MERIGLMKETIRSELRAVYGKEFGPESAEWQEFLGTLREYKLDLARVRMLSRNERSCPGILAVYACRVGSARTDALALGEDREPVAFFRNADLKPWSMSRRRGAA